jgi:hypothetical protein
MLVERLHLLAPQDFNVTAPGRGITDASSTQHRPPGDLTPHPPFHMNLSVPLGLGVLMIPEFSTTIY